MKVLTSRQTREADAYTIAHEPIASIDLMERAASQAFRWLVDRFGTEMPLWVFCGPGNNGGDGLVVARMWHKAGGEVHVFALSLSGETSADFQVNAERLRALDISLTEIASFEDIPKVPAQVLILDALFGSGLTRPVTGLVAQVLERLNNTVGARVAIDIPSGLFAEDNDANEGIIFRAHHTLTFQMPKLAFFLASNFPYTGHWHVLDIGLSPEFLLHTPADAFWVTREWAASFYRPRTPFGHKGTYGHALLLAGSRGKIGAAVLAVRACLRSGAGLLTARIPSCGYDIVQTSVPEAMVTEDTQGEFHTEVPALKQYNALGVGPGIGTHPTTATWLHQVLKAAERPMVLDADALNILAEHPAWLTEVPPHSILTPHPGEFRRLVGEHKPYETLQRLREFAAQHTLVVLLKGRYSAVAFPNGELFFNSTGNPGMATPGSGDVLTGILTGLLAQGYVPGHAALLGMYLHGLAGDLAAHAMSQEALMAGDIVNHLGQAFLQVSELDRKGENA